MRAVRTSRFVLVCQWDATPGGVVAGGAAEESPISLAAGHKWRNDSAYHPSSLPVRPCESARCAILGPVESVQLGQGKEGAPKSRRRCAWLAWCRLMLKAADEAT